MRSELGLGGGAGSGIAVDDRLLLPSVEREEGLREGNVVAGTGRHGATVMLSNVLGGGVVWRSVEEWWKRRKAGLVWKERAGQTAGSLYMQDPNILGRVGVQGRCAVQAKAPRVPWVCRDESGIVCGSSD